MHLIRFACLQKYANKLGCCLLNMCADEDGAASTQLPKYLSELTSLMICMAQGNPKVALKHGLADFYNKQEDEADPNRRKDVFFVDLLVSHCWLSSHCIATCAVMTSACHVDVIWSCRPAATYRQARIDRKRQTEVVATICIWRSTQSASHSKTHVPRHRIGHIVIITHRCILLNL